MSPNSPRAPLRRQVTVPGILRETIQRRMAEFSYKSFSPFAVELICFDLRKRREHLVTRPFADEPFAVQDALDRELARHYQPGSERGGLLTKAVFGEPIESHRDLPRGQYSVFRGNITTPAVLVPYIQQRWQELGYRDFTAYVTGLIRYDLALLGPHWFANGHDTAPDLLASLDAGTIQSFLNNKPEPGYLDELIETVAGRPLSEEELTQSTRGIAPRLCDMVTKPRSAKVCGWAG